MGLEVLKQDSILGIFPEGGTWDPAQMQAQIGVAWLSCRGKAPIIPIGFGGIKGGLAKAFRFQRPKLVMNVGDVIQPVTLTDSGLSMKANLEKAANQIMASINALIPEEDFHKFLNRINETYHLESHINALNAILDYLEINPGYFTYRFGVPEDIAVKEALKELIRLGAWVQHSGYALSVNPIRRHKMPTQGYRSSDVGSAFLKVCESNPFKQIPTPFSTPYRN